jgi:CRISPR-associated endonuclease Cas2
MVYYDISENKARLKVHDYLEAQGFERIQYSVFVGKIDMHRWQKIWAKLCALHARYCTDQDKIYSHVIEANHFRKMSVLGPPLDIPWILQEMNVFFI